MEKNTGNQLTKKQAWDNIRILLTRDDLAFNAKTWEAIKESLALLKPVEEK